MLKLKVSIWRIKIEMHHTIGFIHLSTKIKKIKNFFAKANFRKYVDY